MGDINPETFVSFLLIILLLPVFFAGGWFAARVDLKSVLKQAKSIPTEFYKSLNSLLDKKTNVAAEALNEVFEKGWSNESGDANKVELGLILGKLYRQRGENDKAITLHQTLLNSPDIVQDKQHVIQFQLGLDYYAAGLVDRAESQFEKLLKGSMAREAREVLLSIYQQDRDWRKAINLAKELAFDQETYQFEVAQFYCELAQQSLIQSKLTNAETNVQAALVENKKCARANILLGDIKMKSDHYEEALDAYLSIENQNYKYLSMVAEKIFDVKSKLGATQEGLSILEGYARTMPELDIIDILYQKKLEVDGERAAAELIRDIVRNRPNIDGVYHYLGIKMLDGDAQWKQDAEFLRNVINRYRQKSMMYQCQNCHFRSQVFFWHCPACNKWETFTPNKIEI